MILSWLLVRGVRESAKVNNVMVAIKIAAIALFLVVGGMLVHKSQLGALCALGLQRSAHRRRHRLLHLHRL